MILGDCLEVMPTLSKIDASLLAADLPYGSTGCAWDQSLVDLNLFWSSVDKSCHSEYVGICFSNWSFGHAVQTSNQKRFRYEIVWRKSNITGFFGAKHRPLKSHEYMLVFGPGKIYNPQMTPVGPENSYRPKTVYESIARSEIYGGGLGQQPHRQDNGWRYPRTVYFVPSEKRKLSRHPTQKPVALLDWLIRTYSNAGDMVLDPTSGSGTTAVSACQNGRSVVCIEKDEGYFEASIERVRKHIRDNLLDVKLEVRK